MYFQLLILLYSASFIAQLVSGDCNDVSYSTQTVKFDKLLKINRIAVSGQISAFIIDYAISENHFITLKQVNDHPLVIYSTLAHVPSWTHVDILASAIRIRRAFPESTEKYQKEPLLVLTICDYETQIIAFDDNSYVVDSHKAGLVSMYENELILVFRTFQSGIFFFSMADQGDVLVAQIIRGTVHVIFDFGSLTPSRISGGKALDDGKWHELRWLHQFDSVQLSIDNVILNQTTPTGLYRKLDLHSEIHIAGRPPDDFSEGIETTFHGCLARLQLNSADLLQFAPSESVNKCSMPMPPSLTLHNGSYGFIPFTFLPFSFEFRIFQTSTVLLNMLDFKNETILKVEIDEAGIIFLTVNSTRHRQKANPPVTVSEGSWHSFSLRIRGNRLEVEINRFTVLWLEGNEVKRFSIKLAALLLPTPGCYRSVTIDFGIITTSGNVSRGTCDMIDRCVPSPCENAGVCSQVSLDDYKCSCPFGYRGKNCHTSDLPRSCEEWIFWRGPSRGKVLKGKNVTIDLDGGGPLKAFSVICRTEKDELGVDIITTSIKHDLQTAIIVTGDNAPGAVRKSLEYGISHEELDRLVEGFDNCKQSVKWMKYVCRGGVHLMTHGQDKSPSSWYSTRSDKHGLQWGSAPPYSRMCSCAINGTCKHNRMCNCDSGEDGVDEGYNTYAQLLPVTALFIGGTKKSSSVEVEIGSLKCSNRISFEPVTFSDRNARLTGSRVFQSNTFHIAIQAKFSHPNMNIFVWESADGMHWFQLYIHGGRIVGELLNGGENRKIVSNNTYNDGSWHSIYWEADSYSMILRVDHSVAVQNQRFILPSALHWIIGSRTESGNSGYAGVLRNAHLCGEELMLSSLARKEPAKALAVGEDGYCRTGLCKNNGTCVDQYDGYSCDCSHTPFGGADCTKEYGMWVPLGSSLSIPWQNPAHTSFCHRIAIQSRAINVSLIQSRALFGESTFNMSINEYGYLTLSVYDGFFFTHQDVYQKLNMSDDIMHDISFCASKKLFNLTIDGEESIKFEGNWTFFQTFNVWKFLDKSYTGCVSRLQVGSSFPLKNPKSARLNYSGKIKFGSCPMLIQETNPQYHAAKKSEQVFISTVVSDRQRLISFTSITIGVTIVLIVILALFIYYVRSRPEGVYKTNECGLPMPNNNTLSRSEEPLVRKSNGSQSNEYFC